MQFTFRNILVFEFKENPHGRITGVTGAKYSFDIGEAAHLCSFLNEDLELMQKVLNDCNSVVNGAIPFKILKDIEVY